MKKRKLGCESFRVRETAADEKREKKLYVAESKRRDLVIEITEKL